MRAVVTGAGGFLGSAFCAALRARGDDVLGLDLRPGPGITVADTAAPGAWQADLAGADLLVHTAAIVTEGGDPAEFWRINVGGTRTVLEAAANAGVARVVHLSSHVVLGPRFPDGADETYPVVMTGNPYTDTKVSSEHQALAAAARGLPVTVIRPGDVYGPRSVPWTIRPVRLMRRGLFTLIDGGRGVLVPTYVDDLVEGSLALAASPAAAGEIVFVTGSPGVPAREFFGYYADLLGIRMRSLPARALTPLTRPVEALTRWTGREAPFTPRAIEYITHPGGYSIAKAERLAGWRPRMSLEEGMRLTADWLRAEGLV